jgi:hypothetical protein
LRKGIEVIVSIGLDPDMVAKVKQALSDPEKPPQHILAYDAPPLMYSKDGELFIESKQSIGKFLKPKGVIYYGYFPGIDTVNWMKAIAISDVRCFPDVRRTIFHEDRIFSLIMARQADPMNSPVSATRMPRGWLPRGTEVPVASGMVIKCGNDHCGENKMRLEEDTHIVSANTAHDGALVEPFIDGRSRRILVVGTQAWQIDYESDDWRKNVNAKLTIRKMDGGTGLDHYLWTRSVSICTTLGLHVAGIDYVGHEGNWKLLEVNTYPGLEDIPEAQDTFAELVKWNMHDC